MTSDTLSQPKIALVFLLSGAVGYFTYELIHVIRVLVPIKTVSFIADFGAVLSNGAIFFVASYFYNFGRILFYEVFCYLLSFIILRAFFGRRIKNLAMKFALFVKKKIGEMKNKMNNSFKAAQTKLERRNYERQEHKRICNERKKNRLQNGLRSASDGGNGKPNFFGRKKERRTA